MLPWTDLHYRCLDRLADQLPATLLLIDPQRGNADDMARAIIARALCLNDTHRPCGQCKSCHLLTQGTHPDTASYLEPCKIEDIRAISDTLQNTPAIGALRVTYLGAIDNYNPYALGRKGYINLTLVTDSKDIAKYKPVAQQLLADIEFNQGERYADYNAATDKVAEYGLAALVGGVAAKKLGLLAVIGAFLAKAGKFLIIGAVAVGGAIKSWLGRRRG